MRALKIAQTIYNRKASGILEVKSIGRDKVAIYFQTPQDANKFVESPFLSTQKLSAVIPRLHLTRNGVVRQISMEWFLEELVHSIKCPLGVKVIKARRLNKKRIVE